MITPERRGRTDALTVAVSIAIARLALLPAEGSGSHANRWPAHAHAQLRKYRQLDVQCPRPPVALALLLKNATSESPAGQLDGRLHQSRGRAEGALPFTRLYLEL